MRFAVTATTLVPDPIDCNDVLVKVARVLVVPHSNNALEDDPFGFTFPFNVAELEVTELATPVVSVGKFALVEKLRIYPRRVPTLL